MLRKIRINIDYNPPVVHYQCGFQTGGKKDTFPWQKSLQGQVVYICSTENKGSMKISLKNCLINVLDTSLQGKQWYFFTATLRKKKGINIKVTPCTPLPLDIFPDHFTTFHFSISSASYLYAVGTPQS